MPNTPLVRTIVARLHHPQAGDAWQDCYCFDDPDNDLVGELFVHSATAAITNLCRCITGADHGPQAVQLVVCASDPAPLGAVPDGSLLAELSLLGPEGDGHNYRALVLEPVDAVFAATINYDIPDLWLCPVLPLYFGGAPDRLYTLITPLPNPDPSPAADARL